VTSETTVVKERKWSVKLTHPSYRLSADLCPNCQYPEADGGRCPECGWLAPDPRCQCKDHKRQRGEL